MSLPSSTPAFSARRSQALARLLATVVAAGALLSTGAARAAEGELWETSGTSEAMGMKMPMPPSKECVRPNADPKPEMDKSCKFSGSLTGHFGFKCSQPEPMEGEGDVKRSGDQVTFRMKARMGEMDVLVNQTSRKLGRCTLP